MSVDIEKLKQIYNLLYQKPTIRRIIHSDTHKVKSALLTDLTCGLEKINNNGHYNVYVEKYHDPTNIRTIILDYDGNNAKYDVKMTSSYLKHQSLMHLIVNSTNKGYHIYIILPKFINFQLSASRNFNNKVFTNFILNLVGNRKSLDTVNYGLYSNIRQIGSVHPKTGEILRVEDAYVPYITDDLKIKPEYYSNDITNDAYYSIYDAFKQSLSFIKYKNLIDSAIKYRDRYKKFNDSHVDLRTLFNGKSYDGGKSIWCKCHWHSDNKPSLHVYEKVAYCQVCGEIPFDKIKSEFNLR